MSFYTDSLPKLKSPHVINIQKAAARLTSISKKFLSQDYIKLCADLYEGKNTEKIKEVVECIDSKILRAQNLIMMNEITDIKERIGLVFLYLFSILNDIFSLRYSINDERFLLIDQKKKILKFLTIEQKKINCQDFCTQKNSGRENNQAKTYFCKVAEYIIQERERTKKNVLSQSKEVANEMIKSPGDAKKNRYSKPSPSKEIEFLKHLINFYHKNIFVAFKKCRRYRNNHELNHGLVGSRNKKSVFSVEEFDDICTILETLLFLKD